MKIGHVFRDLVGPGGGGFKDELAKGIDMLKIPKMWVMSRENHLGHPETAKRKSSCELACNERKETSEMCGQSNIEVILSFSKR